MESLQMTSQTGSTTVLHSALTGRDFLASPLNPSVRSGRSQNLLFIDSHLPNLANLVAAAQPEAEVHVLNDLQDAVSQITTVLLGRSGIESVQILSHGQAGSLLLGHQVLDLATLPSYVNQLQSWRSALAPGADLMLYGCDVGQGVVGQTFVEALSRLTGADVAASNNLTGSADRGGDWTLEVQTGAIEHHIANAIVAQYHGTLAASDLDLTWGGTGKVSTDLSGNQYDSLSKLLVQPDGKVLAIGGWKDLPTQFAVVRYNSDGSLDSGFGSSGISLVPLSANGSSADDTPYSAALQSDGKIVLVGSTQPNSSGHVGVVRLNANGSLDTTFNGNGYADIDASLLEFGASNSSYGRDVTIQSDGKILIAANVANASDGNDRASVVRLNSNGSLDSSFGGNGIAAFPLETPGLSDASRILLQSDGNIVVVGYASRDINNTNLSDVLVFRLQGTNGALDPTFNGGNLLTLKPSTLERGIANNFDSGYSAALQSDGKIVITGNASDTAFSFSDVFVLRLNPNGTLDNTFDNNGVVIADINGGDDSGEDIAIQQNGKIIVVGYADKPSSFDSDSLVLRYNANGSLDTSWNSSGKLTIDNGPSTAEEADSVALQSDGKILIAASDGTSDLNQQNFFSMRFVGDPINHPPTTTNSTVSTLEDTAYTFKTADFNFSDIDVGNTLQKVQITQLPTAGSLQLNGANLTGTSEINVSDITAGNLKFIPSLNANGTGYASFQFQVSDGQAYSNAAILTVNVTPVNDPPTTTNNTVTTLEDTAYTFKTADFNFSDVDAGDTLQKVQITQLPTAGQLQLNGLTLTGTPEINISDITAGNLKFVPSLNANGTSYASFQFQISDGQVYSNPATLTVNVTPVNDPPTTTNNTVTTLEDTAYTLKATDFNFADVDTGDTLQKVQITQLPTAGQLQLNGVTLTGTPEINVSDITAGNLKFVPSLNANGTGYASFQFQVSDGQAYSNAATLTVNVTPVNDAPIFTPGANQTVFAGTPLRTIAQWATGFTPGPVDEAGQSIAGYQVTVDRPELFAIQPAISSDGTLTFQAVGDVATPSTATITVQVQDTGGTANGGVDLSSPQTFTITIQPKPQLNIANANTTEGDTGSKTLTFSVSLSAATTETVTLNYATADGTATTGDGDYTASSGTLTFQPGQITQTISVTINGDRTFEPDETFQVQLSNITNANPSSTSGTGTILNDDPKPTVTIADATPQFEGSTLGATVDHTFTVTLSNPSDQTVNVTYSTADGTATIADNDYLGVSNGILSFAPNETSKTIVIKSNSDRRVEADETFTVQLISADTATLGSKTLATGIILNDDVSAVGLWWDRSSGRVLSSPIDYTGGFVNGSDLPNIGTSPDWKIKAEADFDGDGDKDLLWYNSQTGQAVFWKMNGLAFDSAIDLGTVSTRWRLEGAGNFNTDPNLELVWRDTTTGEVVLWLMNGFTFTGQGGAVNLNPGLDWQILRIDDLNKDGQSEILWEQNNTGQVAWWHLNGTQFSEAGELATIGESVTWQLKGTYDFDNNGSKDLLWQNAATGQLAVWKLKNLSFDGGLYLQQLSADPNQPALSMTTPWEFAGVVNQDADPDAEILWRNTSSGQLLVWQMQQFALASTQSIGTLPSNFSFLTFSDGWVETRTSFPQPPTPTGELVLWNATSGQISQLRLQNDTFLGTQNLSQVPFNWQLKATADFEGNGDKDLVWYNPNTGELWLQKRSGNALNSPILLGSETLAWQFAGVASFNGDAQVDFVWRNTTTGAVKVWLSNPDTTYTKSDVALNPGTGWQLLQVADLDRNGRSELIWGNKTTGDVYLWQMTSAGQYDSNRFLAQVGDLPNWSISGVYDLDGDGDQDLIWRNQVTGALAFWQMNGLDFQAGISLGSVDSSWQIQDVGNLDTTIDPEIVWKNRNSGEIAIWHLKGFSLDRAQILGTLPDPTAFVIDLNGAATVG